jgi:predicted PurR-regulated permease PerM
MSQARLIPREHPLTLGQQVVRTLVFALVAVAAGAVVWALSFLMAPLVLAVLGYYVLRPLVNLLESRGLARSAAVFVCFGAGLALVAVMGVVLWPSLNSWLQQTPSEEGTRSVFEVQLANRLEIWEQAGSKAYPKLQWHTLFGRLRTVLEAQRRELMETLPQMALAALSNAGTFLLAPIISLFLLLDGAAMRQRVMGFVPNRYFETVLVLLHRVDRQIAAYLKGAASESALVAVLLSTLLWLAGMPHAVLFGCLYGALNVIPLLGPVLGAGSGLLYAILDPTAPPMALLMACYAGTYVLDAGLINPLVVGKSLDMHPLTLILGVSIGGALGGILGMLASVPVIAVSKAILGTVAEAFRNRSRARAAT